MIRKHRILFAIPVNEDSPDTYFASLPFIDLNRSIHFAQRSQPLAEDGEDKDEELDTILQEQHNTNFRSDYGTLPFWRLIILQTPEVETEFTACFVYHHAIGDGVSGVVFHDEFRKALDAACSTSALQYNIEERVMPDENVQVLPPVEELHPLPVNPTPPAPGAANLKEWTGKSIHAPCRSRWTSLYVSAHASRAFFAECKAKGLSVTPALSSIIASVLFRTLPQTEEALTCIIPISLRPWLSTPREAANAAIGTYFDATRVKLTKPDQNTQDVGSTDIWPGASQVSKAMKDYLCNVSPSGEPYTAIAVLKGIPDFSVICGAMLGQPRDAAFEVTNVGQIPAPASPQGGDDHIWQVGKVLLSRSALVSGAAITVSVATGGNGSMAIGFSWQEGVLENDILDNVINGVNQYFEKYKQGTEGKDA